jgi:dTMP kinase
MKRGVFIVFEGIDGAGKTTQTNLLIRHLKKTGKRVMFIHFPQYQTKSGGLIENYLQGVYGKIGPYQASIFYAADRFDGGFRIRKWLKQRYIVVADRYWASNIGHQGGKIQNKKQREQFFAWLHKLEYGLFGIPKPTISFLLYMPPKVAHRLTVKHAKEQGKKLDIHEKSLVHLQNADRAYQHAIRFFKNGFRVINSMKGKSLRTPKDIHQEIWNKVQKLL